MALEEDILDEDLAHAWGLEVSEVQALTQKVTAFRNQDPQKCTTEIYGVIAHMLQDAYGDLDSGPSESQCEVLAEQIMTEIHARWELVDHETFKDIQNRANLYRSL
jgi:hypothetical protein